MKEGATLHRQPRSMEFIHQVDDIDDLRASKESFESIYIDVEVVDKVILRTVVDDGSSVNIMPYTTMEN